MAFTVGMLPPLLPVIAGEWTLGHVQVGLINTVYAVGRLAGSYPATRVRARWGTRAALFPGLLGLVAGAAGCALAPGFPGFLAGRLVMGLGASAAFLAIFAEMLESASPASRGRLANAFEAMSIVSLAAGGILASGLQSRVGWRGIFLGAAVGLCLGFTAWRAINPLAGRRPETAVSGAPPTTSGALAAMLPVYAASLSLSLTWSGLFSTLVPLLGHERYGLVGSALGLALGAGYAAELLGLLGLALVIDRVRAEPVFLAGAVSVALGGLLLAVGAHAGVFVLGLVLIGAGYANWMIPATVLAGRTGGSIPPAHLAAYRIAMDTGMIVGPLLLGALSETAGDRVAVGVAGVFLIAGALTLARR